MIQASHPLMAGVAGRGATVRAAFDGAIRWRVRMASGAGRLVQRRPRWLRAESLAEVPGLSPKRRPLRGAWVLGGLRYEAARAFDAALSTHGSRRPATPSSLGTAPEPWPRTAIFTGACGWHDPAPPATAPSSASASGSAPETATAGQLTTRLGVRRRARTRPNLFLA